MPLQTYLNERVYNTIDTMTLDLNNHLQVIIGLNKDHKNDTKSIQTTQKKRLQNADLHKERMDQSHKGAHLLQPTSSHPTNPHVNKKGMHLYESIHLTGLVTSPIDHDAFLSLDCFEYRTPIGSSTFGFDNNPTS